MDLSTILIAVVLALVATAALFIVGSIEGNFIQRRIFRQFAALQCGGCQQPFGLEAILAGKDITPFEELWCDEEEGSVSYGCFPNCRLVVCRHCQERGTFATTARVRNAVRSSRWMSLGRVFPRIGESILIKSTS